MSESFVQYAVKVFQTLNWKPARPDTRSKPGLVVWGNLDNQGFGTHCVIDLQAALFKVQVKIRNETEILEMKLIAQYQSQDEAIALFEKYMDLAGGTVHSFVCK